MRERAVAKISTGRLYVLLALAVVTCQQKIRGMLKGKKAKRGVCTYPPVYLR